MVGKNKWPPMPQWWPSPIPYPPPKNTSLGETCRIIEAQLADTLPDNWAVELDPTTMIATILAPNGEMARLGIIWFPGTPTPQQVKAMLYDLGISKS